MPLRLDSKLVCVLAGALLSAAASGCSTDRTSSSTGSAPSGSAPAGSAPLSAQNSSMIPANAKEVASGAKELRLKPDDDGIIYMTDETISRIVLRKRIRAGQSFDFSVRSGLARIDGQTVYQQSSSNGHQFKLYFEKE